jgi:drug/metabolite transporter (DMT)-like permease
MTSGADSSSGRAAFDPRGMVAVVIAAVSFGACPTLARYAYDSGSDAATNLFVRSLAAFVGVYILARCTGLRPRFLSRDSLKGALVGIPLALASLGYLGSVNFIPVGLATLIFYTFPLVVAVLARVVDGERLTVVRSTALCTAFVGVALTLGADFYGIDGRGVALALLASISIAIVFLLSSRLMRSVDSLTANFYMMTTSLVGFALWMLLDRGFAAPATASGWSALLGGGVLYIAGVATFFIAIARIGSVPTAALLNLEPLVSLICALLVLGEILAPLQYVGGAMILGAILYMNWREYRDRAERPA